MQKKLKNFLIVLLCILSIACVFLCLTWFKVIPNWFNIEFYDRDDWDYDWDNDGYDRECRAMGPWINCIH